MLNKYKMTRRGKGLLNGAVFGGGIGLLRSAFDDPARDGFYVAQTTAGWIAGHVFFALPWAFVGALIGVALSWKQAVTLPVTATERVEGAAVLIRHETTAGQRLGHVLGWAGNCIAIPLLALGLYGFMQELGDPFIKGAAIAAGVLAFLIGRALRYILAGPKTRPS